MLLLTTSQLVRYLIRRSDVRGINDWLRLRTQRLASKRSRNQCFLAWWGQDEAWFVKQPFTDLSPADGIFNEARFYDFIEHRLPNWLFDKSGLTRNIPQHIAFDPTNRVLLLKRLNDFRPVPAKLHGLGELDLRTSDFPEKAAVVLRAFHVRLTQRKVFEYQRENPFRELRPLLLVSQEVLLKQVLVDNPLANGTFLNTLRTGLIRDPKMLRILQWLNQAWSKSPKVLIHGDTAWRNWMYKPEDDQRAKVELRLVDWEQACWGDPRWDQAVFIADYFLAKLADNAVSPGRILEHAKRFYRAYYDQNPDTTKFSHWAEFVFRLAALSLIQRLLETFIGLVNARAEDRRQREIKLANICREWLRLLADPFKFFNSFTDASDGVFTETGIALARLD